MKKFLVFLILMLVAAPVVSIAADINAGEYVNPVYFTSLAGLAAVIVPVTSFVNKALGLTGALKQYLSWIVALVLGLIPWWFDLGIFNGVQWYVAMIYSFAAGLVANGLYDIDTVRKLLELLHLEPKRINSRRL